MKLDRLMGILMVLLRQGTVTAPALAERFEVSRRTISRDIDALCMAGIPICTRQGNGGGISIAEGFRLDRSVLTLDELSSTIAAVKGLGTVSGKSQMERVLDKLAPGGDAVVSLRESVVIDLASHYKGSLTEKIEQIKGAIHTGHRIAFAYAGPRGESHRCVEPYFITFRWTAWYVFGYCLQRQDFRLFKLARLWDLVICAETFAPRDIPPGKEDLDAWFSDDILLVADFAPAQRYRLIETYGHACYTETPEGLLRLQVGFTNRDYMLQWLLGFGDQVRVLAPVDLVEEIQTIAARMVKRYL